MEAGVYRYSGHTKIRTRSAFRDGQSSRQTDLSGRGFRCDFAVGSAVARDLVLAGEASIGLYSLEHKSIYPGVDVSYSANLTSGVLLDAWLSRSVPLHTFVAAGIEIAGFALTFDDVQRSVEYPSPGIAVGPYGAVGAGWDMVRGKAGSFGIAARVQMARMSNGDATYIPFNAALLASICTF